MNSFMDKLAQKLNAEEIIQANRTADIDQKIQKKQQEEMAVLQKEFDKIQGELKGLKENLDGFRDTVENLRISVDSLQKFSGNVTKTVEASLAASNDYVHKESVKVYRNVQAVVVEEAAKGSEKFKALEEKAAALQASVDKVNARKKTPGIQKWILVLLILNLLMTGGYFALQIIALGLLNF